MSVWVKQLVELPELKLSAMVECAEGSVDVHVSFASGFEDQDHFVFRPGCEHLYRQFLEDIDVAILLVRGAAAILGWMSTEHWRSKFEIITIDRKSILSETPWVSIGRERGFHPTPQWSDRAFDLLVGQGLAERKNNGYIHLYRRIAADG